MTDGGIEPQAEVVVLAGLVKWFNEEKGYGFIIPDNGARDVLLHASVLRRDGFGVPPTGAHVTFKVSNQPKGPQCFKVLAVDISTAAPNTTKLPKHTASSSGWVEARVKYLNHEKGYGFLRVEGVMWDVFFRMEQARKSGVANLKLEQLIYVQYEKVSKGFRVTEMQIHAPPR